MSDNDRTTVQAAAFLIAHRAILGYLAKVVQTYIPSEGSCEMIDARATMLRDAMSQLFAQWPEMWRSTAIAMAEDEIDAVLTFLEPGPGNQ